MKYIYFTFIASSFLFTSCKNEETAQPDPRVIVPFTQQAATGIQAQTPAAPAGNHNLFKENNMGSNPSVAAGINPAHGQPNHRCDIAVGAPLNSPANGATPTQAVNVQSSPQMVTTTQPTTVKTVTAKGMNPPHGEKNHRCDIAVGAPLNSKAAVATTTANTGEITQQVTVPQALPKLLSTSSADGETPEGMNPPHGKEGHRCDIAVGAPLPKS